MICYVSCPSLELFSLCTSANALMCDNQEKICSMSSSELRAVFSIRYKW